MQNLHVFSTMFPPYFLDVANYETQRSHFYENFNNYPGQCLSWIYLMARLFIFSVGKGRIIRGRNDNT